jgi:extradiol dioxygenase family protein
MKISTFTEPAPKLHAFFTKNRYGFTTIRIIRGVKLKSIFHLAIHVTDLEAARTFYGQVLGCTEGRSTDSWIDFDFFGHQLSLHLGIPFSVSNTGKVENIDVPMPHFGAVLVMSEWKAIAHRLESANIHFEYGPVIRFKGEPGEQATMFFRDPAGNPIELKGFASLETVFDS